MADESAGKKADLLGFLRAANERSKVDPSVGLVARFGLDRSQVLVAAVLVRDVSVTPEAVASLVADCVEEGCRRTPMAGSLRLSLIMRGRRQNLKLELTQLDGRPSISSTVSEPSFLENVGRVLTVLAGQGQPLESDSGTISGRGNPEIGR